MLFSLLPPEVQPVPTLKSLLSFPTGSASGFRTVKSAVVVGQDLDLESIFGESPSALLPEELRPRYDEGAKAFFVPGVPRLASEREVELAFGARGPFPISKVRGGGRTAPWTFSSEGREKGARLAGAAQGVCRNVVEANGDVSLSRQEVEALWRRT